MQLILVCLVTYQLAARHVGHTANLCCSRGLKFFPCNMDFTTESGIKRNNEQHLLLLLFFTSATIQ